MAWIETHCEDCRSLLGEEFRRVHEFLDQYAEIFKVGIFNEYHRTFLHNKYGLSIVRSRWGYEAYLAGIIHISRDYHESGMNDKDMDWIMTNFGKALLYFNNMDNFEPHIQHRVLQGWDNKSLCWIAFKNSGCDKHYRSLEETI